MIVDVDVRTLSIRNGGISSYTFGLWQAFAERYPEVTLHFYSHNRLLPDFPLNHIEMIKIPQRWIGQYVWENWAFPCLLQSSSVPVGMDFYLSKNHKSKGIVFVYDLMFLDSSDSDYRDNMLTRVRSSIETGHQVVTISNHCRSQISKYFSLPEHRIGVVYPGVSSVSDGLEKSGNDEETSIIYTGELSHRKNIVAMLEAVKHLFNTGHNFNFHLIGKATADQPDIDAAISMLGLKNEERVKWLGWVSEQQKNKLWSSADLLLFPSRDEGFGMPVVEAMACGIPVVTSDGGALSEVAGDAALITPLEGEGFSLRLAENIKIGLYDKEHRKELVSRGYKNARRFLWHNSAGALFDLLEEIND